MDEHDQLKSLLTDFVAGSLKTSDHERIRSHMDHCPRCLLNARILRQLAPATQGQCGRDPSPECLARISELAGAHRRKVLANRRQAGLTAAMALLGWAMVILTLPLWQWLAATVRVRSGLALPAGPLAAFALGALLCYLFLPGIWALLERNRATDNQEGCQ